MLYNNTTEDCWQIWNIWNS